MKLPTHRMAATPLHDPNLAPAHRFLNPNYGVPVDTAGMDFLPPKNLLPRCSSSKASAFSLTEVVLAMGVAAVAFTTIIGLFPLGLSMSKESYESTQAALIAQSLMGQAIDAQGGTGNTGFRRFAITPSNDPTKGTLFSIDVGNYNPTADLYLAYTNYLETNGLSYWKPSKTISSNEWSSISSSAALVRVSFKRIFTGGKTYDIHGVEVQVDYPGNVPYTNRTHEIFSRICH